MKTRLQKLSEDRLAITGRNKQSKKSINGGENSELIPIDLIIEILSRLPAKSIARCRYASKLWASTLGLAYFTELFLTRSLARPQLLFTCKSTSTSIELRVLQDVEKQEWSEHTYVLPTLWQNMVGDACLLFVGVTRKNEIVLSSYYQTVPFYVFYYNTERNTTTRVGIQGMEAFKDNRVYTYLDHVENVKLL